jgi:hypothetical protein
MLPPEKTSTRNGTKFNARQCQGSGRALYVDILTRVGTIECEKIRESYCHNLQVLSAARPAVLESVGRRENEVSQPAAKSSPCGVVWATTAGGADEQQSSVAQAWAHR